MSIADNFFNATAIPNKAKDIPITGPMLSVAFLAAASTPPFITPAPFASLSIIKKRATNAANITPQTMAADCKRSGSILAIIYIDAAIINILIAMPFINDVLAFIFLAAPKSAEKLFIAAPAESIIFPKDFSGDITSPSVFVMLFTVSFICLIIYIIPPPKPTANNFL